MPIPAKLSKIEDVPDALRTLYRKTESGAYVLDVAPVEGYGLDDVETLRTEVAKAQERWRKATEKLKGYEEDGALPDPGEIKQALAAHRKKKPEEDQVAQKYQAAIEKLQSEYAAAQKEIQQLVVTDQLRAAIVKHQGDADLLMPVLERHVRSEKGPDGKWRAVVVDGEAPRMTRKQGSVQPMDIDEFVGSIAREKYARAFPATTGPGSGARTASGVTAQPFTLTESQAKDPAAYRAAKAAANQAGTQVQIQ